VVRGPIVILFESSMKSCFFELVLLVTHCSLDPGGLFLRFVLLVSKFFSGQILLLHSFSSVIFLLPGFGSVRFLVRVHLGSCSHRFFFDSALAHGVSFTRVFSGLTFARLTPYVAVAAVLLVHYVSR
jgi:hypothetical protein